MSKKQLTSREDFKKVVEQEDTFLMFKHSLTCPVSQQAFEELDKFLEDYSVPTYYLYVQDSRELSNYIAETYNVVHQSPQALLIKKDQVLWNDSHWNITYDKLLSVTQENQVVSK